jgi:glycine/D-amino acid oxidase-like deaminating enzyme
VRRVLPRLGARPRSATCRDPRSKDGHFSIEAIPDTHGRVFAAVGLSGHGFKFAPVIGETIARLALGQKPEIDAGHFSLKRF